MLLRIDEVLTLPDGRVEVRFTTGADPLPEAWDGRALVFPSAAALRAVTAPVILDDVALCGRLLRAWRAADAELRDLTKVRGTTTTGEGR